MSLRPSVLRMIADRSATILLIMRFVKSRNLVQGDSAAEKGRMIDDTQPSVVSMRLGRPDSRFLMVSSIAASHMGIPTGTNFA